MCYDIKTSLETQLKYAKRYDADLIPEIQEKITPCKKNWSLTGTMFRVLIIHIY